VVGAQERLLVLLCQVSIRFFLSIKKQECPICFSLTLRRDIGVQAIEKLMKKRGKFDYILLETTGLADPGESERKRKKNIFNPLFFFFLMVFMLFRSNCLHILA
jgi:hypothetical protein